VIIALSNEENPIIRTDQALISLYVCEKPTEMTTLTVKINERTKAGSELLAVLKAFAKKSGVKVVKEEEDAPYDPEFVKMVLDAAEKGEYTEVDPKDVWGSLGLK